MEENKNNEVKMNSEINQTNEQSVKLNKKSIVVPMLSIIIILLVLVVILCIGNMYALIKDYDNVFDMAASVMNGETGKTEENDEDSNKNDNMTEYGENKNETPNILEDASKDYVYERESYTNPYFHGNGIEIPYININSEDAKKINQEIYKKYEDAVKTILQVEEAPQAQLFTDIDYKYSVLENILCVCIDETPMAVPGGGFVRQRTVYNLSLEDGRKLSTQETLEKFNLKESELIEKINVKLKEKYSNGDYKTIGETMTEEQYVKGFEYDINEIYFESDISVEVLFEGDSVPYGDLDIKVDISNYIYVSESYDFEYSYQNDLVKAKIERAYINIDSEDAKKANQEIYTMYEAAKKSVSDIKKMDGFKDIEYDYNIIGDMLYLRVTDYWVQIGSEATGEDTIYYFDLENGKKLSTQETLKKLNLTEDKLIEKINLKLKEMYSKGEMVLGNETFEEYVEGIEYDINKIHFKSDTTAKVTLTGPKIDDNTLMGSLGIDVNF